ncbi:copper homeostasis membrane protein CopD [Brevundimonas sp.]|uniref:copper homeostasis membrane protein CopD n=1 Tax=Brevundimonas sp. TaxID=1871086 RepID=UPI0025BB2CFA|nr:copper homeostasis membrane protein CopD [Brevundimonas sp.]
MLEITVILLRWLQYAGAVVLMGAPLFWLVNDRREGGLETASARPVLATAAAVTAVAALTALVAQTAMMTGSLAEAVKPEALSFMVGGTALGMALIVRAATAGLGLVAVLMFRPGRGLWSGMVLAGAIVTASFAWTGHGAATEGWGGAVHLAADVVHALAAALWLGALVAMVLLLLRREGRDDWAMHRALHGFAGLGTVTVVLLTLTGIVNSGFLVGLGNIGALGDSPYGRLLIVKLALFVLMLALAAGNRFRLTPELHSVLSQGQATQGIFRRLRRSIVVETLTGVALLAVVAAMGMMAPPSAL